MLRIRKPISRSSNSSIKVTPSTLKIVRNMASFMAWSSGAILIIRAMPSIASRSCEIRASPASAQPIARGRLGFRNSRTTLSAIIGMAYDPQPQPGHQPRPGRRTDIGAEDDPYHPISAINPAPRNEMMLTETSGPDCSSVVTAIPKPMARGVDRVTCCRIRSRASTETPDTVFRHQHAEQEDCDSGGDFLGIRAEPERQQQKADRDRKQKAPHVRVPSV